jgi:hypothetical protein
VTPAPHRDFEFMFAREFDGAKDIIGADTPCDQSWLSLRVGIPKEDASRGLVTGVGG